MGLLPEELTEGVGTKIDFEKMRLLGMHLVEYADRHGVEKKELKNMLRMIGL
jgi:hypothetical protein